MDYSILNAPSLLQLFETCAWHWQACTGLSSARFA
jgi:hypothetical protein